jgi:hypothetical protein
MYRTRKVLVLIAAGAGMAAVLNAPLAAADDTLLPDCSDPGNQAIATECALPGTSPSYEGEEDAFYGFPGFAY